MRNKFESVLIIFICASTVSSCNPLITSTRDTRGAVNTTVEAAKNQDPQLVVELQLKCADLKVFPGFEVNQKIDCELVDKVTGKPSGDQLISDFGLSGCSTLKLSKATGLLTGRAPLNSCKSIVLAKFNDKAYSTEFLVLPKTKVKHFGRKFNSPIYSYSFGIEKKGTEFWSYGQIGINVFDGNLKFLRSISRANSRLPSDRIDSFAILGANIFAGTTNGLARSSDNGKTWNVLPIADSLGNRAYFNNLASTPSTLYGNIGQTLYTMDIDGRELGLDKDTMDRCLSSADISGKIAEDIAVAGRVGVNATPSIFVNGKPYTGGLEIETMRLYLDKMIGR